MESCYQEKVCNCMKDCSCDNGYECCSETVPKGKKSKYGICVETGTCDKSRGICNSKSKSKNVLIDQENYRVNSTENFELKNTDWLKWVIFFGVIVIVIIIVARIIDFKGDIKSIFGKETLKTSKNSRR